MIRGMAPFVLINRVGNLIGLFTRPKCVDALANGHCLERGRGRLGLDPSNCPNGLKINVGAQTCCAHLGGRDKIAPLRLPCRIAAEVGDRAEGLKLLQNAARPACRNPVCAARGRTVRVADAWRRRLARLRLGPTPFAGTMQSNLASRMISAITVWCVGPALAAGPQLIGKTARRQAAALPATT